MSPRINPKGSGPPPVQAELPLEALGAAAPASISQLCISQ